MFFPQDLRKVSHLNKICGKEKYVKFNNKKNDVYVVFLTAIICTSYNIYSRNSQCLKTKCTEISLLKNIP